MELQPLPLQTELFLLGYWVRTERKEMGNIISLRDRLPKGYRFHPTEEELVAHYLMRRVRKIEDHPCIIPKVDIYKHDPRRLPRVFHSKSIVGQDDQVQEWWFFCPLTPVSSGRSIRVRRWTPSGYWKKTGKTKKVKARGTRTPIGTRKYLVFYEGKGKTAKKTSWVLHEYGLLARESQSNSAHVLCHLKHGRWEEADDSTTESERADYLLHHQPNHEDLIPQAWVQAWMRSLMELLTPQNQRESLRSLMELLTPQNQREFLTERWQFVEAQQLFFPEDF